MENSEIFLEEYDEERASKQSEIYRERLNQLLDEYGNLEDDDLVQIGISLNEFLHPNEEILAKISCYLVERLERGISR